MRPWHLGNTTVRSPFRLRDGLVAISTSPLQGDLRGEEQEKALRTLLGEHGIVELGSDETYSVGRKWRSALGKLGFLFPELPGNLSVRQYEIGKPDSITPSGWRLVRAETVPAMQECFLRSLAAIYIPSPVERGYDFTPFSPLRHTLSVMSELERRTGDSLLNFIEMALVVQVSSTQDGVGKTVDFIINLRDLRKAAPNKRHFDQQEYNAAAARYDYKPLTFRDYADTNFRYLKATGLVNSRGKGISLVSEKRLFIDQLIHEKDTSATELEYFSNLCNGARLPTDDASAAREILDDLVAKASSIGIVFDTQSKILVDSADIAVARHEIEELLSAHEEEVFAANQATSWREICLYMDLLIERRRSITTTEDDFIEIPQAEAPAYFEWTVWRAFLAIDSLVNRPFESRRFKIDQDFRPVGTAPGGGPDLIFEFSDFVVVVEVTLTENSRQEAVEGEPVRRHVADLVQLFSKPVYGLFIANRIDSNTAETFRIGVWYDKEDQRKQLDIIPMTLVQFKTLFEAFFANNRIEASLIREILDRCKVHRASNEAPAWKILIQETITHFVEGL